MGDNLRRTPRPKRNGRPPIELDWEDIERMCFIQCTMEEIALVCQVDTETLDRACKREFGIAFTTFSKQKRAGGKKSLRRAQFQTAVEGKNPTLLIWLGKQMLGQSDDPAPEDAPAEKYGRPDTMNLDADEEEKNKI